MTMPQQLETESVLARRLGTGGPAFLETRTFGSHTASRSGLALYHRSSTCGRGGAQGRSEPPLCTDFDRHAACDSPGFTVVELLVLVAVIALWALMLAPALARTRPDVKAIQCRANLKRLMAAWQMYSDDNQGRLVPNREGPMAGKVLERQSWVAGWMSFGAYSAENTNINLLVNPAFCQGYGALLGPYVKSPRVFKCPADKALVVELGGEVPRVRSISMNNCVGEGARQWTSGSQFQTYEKFSQIYKPPPADLWILLDEHEQSINDGTFFSDPDVAWQMIDFPASYHGGACGFSFADGHAEIHKWLDSRTMPPFDPSRYLTLNLNLPNDVDVLWLQQHATALP